MKNINAARAALGWLVVVLAGCGDPDPSTDIPTERIYARFIAETGADGASQVRADFFEEEGFFLYEAVYLAGGDTLAVRTEESHLLFTGGGTHFEGELPSGVLENTRFEFDLERPQLQDAPNSWGTLPAPMDLWLPEAGTEYSIENDQLTVAWNYGGTIDDMWLEVDARCIAPDEPDDWWRDESFTLDIPGDPGLYTFRLSDAIYVDQCERYAATLTLYRARAGVLDDAYKPDEQACGDNHNGHCSQDGYVSIRQVRSVPVTLSP